MDSTVSHVNPEQLCSICAKIDIRGLMQTPANRFPEATWPASVEEMKNSNCRLCSTFASICGNDRGSKQQLLALTELPAGRTTYSMARPVTSSKGTIPCVFFAMLRENKGQYSRVIHEILERGFIVPQSMNSKAVYHVDSRSVNFKLLRHWLETCKHEHPGCQKPTNLHQHLDYLKLIDCESFNIVTVQPHAEKYLTLSYVRGEEQMQRVSFESEAGEDKRDLRSAPKTIQDAMAAVKNLGYRYIWIDRYCIDELSDMETELMMGNMDLIYGNSEATIIAAYGKSPFDGLPGVTDVERSPQLRVSYDGLELCATLPSVVEVIYGSEWNTRGWTYQEARLSKRLLVFSEHQVYFVCGSDCRSEAVWSTFSGIHNVLNNFRIDPALFQEGKTRGDGVVIDRFAYSNRILSRQRDGLDAFRGILSRSTWISFWGVTITLVNSGADVYDGFAMGLLWIRPTTLDTGEQFPSPRKLPEPGHRQGFPSWSWTSIIGPVFFDRYKPESTLGSYTMQSSYPSPENLSKLCVWVLNEASDWEPLQTRIENQESNIIKEIDARLLIEGDVVKLWRETQDNSTAASKKKRNERKRREQQAQKEFWWFEGSPDPVSVLTSWRPDHITEEHPCLTPHHALVLVHWQDPDQSPSKRRFVLMVLDELEDDKFKRVGILSKYREDWEESDVSKIAMQRRKFTLV